MRVVLDTNVLVSGIFFGGIPSKIVQSWLNGRFAVYATPLILLEYLRVIDDLSTRGGQVLSQEWEVILPEICHVIPDVKSQKQISRDIYDDKFLFCAMSAESNFLVTGDKDLRALSEVFNFKIVSPREFLSEI